MKCDVTVYKRKNKRADGSDILQAVLTFDGVEDFLATSPYIKVDMDDGCYIERQIAQRYGIQILSVDSHYVVERYDEYYRTTHEVCCQEAMENVICI